MEKAIIVCDVLYIISQLPRYVNIANEKSIYNPKQFMYYQINLKIKMVKTQDVSLQLKLIITMLQSKLVIIYFGSLL
jgi:hypothetical protein